MYLHSYQEYLAVVDLEDILSFTFSATSFIVVIQADDDRQDRRYFSTSEGREIRPSTLQKHSE